MAYRIVLARRLHEQLRDAPPELRGYVAGVVALLRTDPSVGTAAFPVVRGPVYHTIVFPQRHGYLDYCIVGERQMVVLVDLTWR